MRPAHPHVAVCENCRTALQGPFCHHCGQSAHNPVRSFGHAVEEVFESFWHLDGRVFRTLRQLLLPGRLAADYLAGHRTRYMPPMRLFVILSVLTFFVARLAVHVDGGNLVQQSNGSTEAAVALRDATTTDEVEQVRQALVAPLEQSRSAMSEGVRAKVDRAIARVDRQAERRRQQLAAQAADPSVAGDVAEPQDTPKATIPAELSRPVEIGFLPAFANRWLTGQAEAIRQNLPRINEKPQLLVNAFFASVPSVLFVLVPLFALLLKVFYLGSGRLYLEHLVVALYSHAFLCMAMLGIVLLSIPEASAALPWLITVTGVATALLLAWMPLYLLLMQRRVYGESWLLTTVKFLVLGGIYFSVVTAATVLLVIASLARV